MANLDPLSSPCGVSGTEIAQRFLNGALDSVEAVLDNLTAVRAARRQTGEIRGRVPANEEDLLRAAIVFAGAGLDSSVKRLIRDTLPELLDFSSDAQEKFESFCAARLGSTESVDVRALARYLVSPNPRDRLLDDYVYWLTGSSLQSAEELSRTAGALGLTDAELRRQVTELKPLFVARNQIVHELDLQRPGRPGDRSRRSRRMQEYVAMSRRALEAAQCMINAVGLLLSNGRAAHASSTS